MHMISKSLAILLLTTTVTLADDAQDRLKAFGQLLGQTSYINTVRPDGDAMIYSMAGVVDEAARMVTRLEVDGDPCLIRTTTLFQKPPGWAQMSVTVTDFTKVQAIDGYATHNDLSSQKNGIPISDVKAIGFTLKGKGLSCRTSYLMAEKPAEIYSYCEDRIDRWAFDQPEQKVDVLNALARVADLCKLPFLKP